MGGIFRINVENIRRHGGNGGSFSAAREDVSSRQRSAKVKMPRQIRTARGRCLFSQPGRKTLRNCNRLISSCTESVLIEMVGDTDSLNVSCASTILMWEMSKVFNGISVRSVTDHG